MYVCMYVCMCIFRRGGLRPRKVPFWGTGRAELGVSVYDLITQSYWIGRGLVVLDAKLNFPVKRISCKTRKQTTPSSISSAQTAHRIEPVTRQREDQARLRNRSHKISLLSGRSWWACGRGNSRLPSSGHSQMKGEPRNR
jgi:hypothetical protein